MPTTQHRPHGAYAGPLFGTLDGKTEDLTPPVEPPKTQHRPHGAFAGPLFGTLSGKTAEAGIDWELDVPTLGPALSATFAASGDFAFSDAVIFNLEPAGPVALSGTIDASGDFAASEGALATVTVRLVDAAVSGAALPDLAAVQWAWWDTAADESETWGVMPTAQGTAESTDGTGAIQLEAVSAKTSGQTVLIKLYQHGYPPRAFTGLLTVD
jgi:hypothetical protein